MTYLMTRGIGDAAVFKRVWCLYEMLCTLELGEAGVLSTIHDVVEDFEKPDSSQAINAVNRAILDGCINLELAEASVPSDRVMIHNEVITKHGGFVATNAAVKCALLNERQKILLHRALTFLAIFRLTLSVRALPFMFYVMLCLLCFGFLVSATQSVHSNNKDVEAIVSLALVLVFSPVPFYLLGRRPLLFFMYYRRALEDYKRFQDEAYLNMDENLEQ